MHGRAGDGSGPADTDAPHRPTVGMVGEGVAQMIRAGGEWEPCFVRRKVYALGLASGQGLDE